MRVVAIASSVLVATFAAACTTTSTESHVADRAKPAPHGADLSRASCERQNPGVGLAREGDARQGAAVALARAGNRLMALVADKDSKRIDVVDVGAGSVDATVPVDGAPEQVLVLADGRVVATIADGSRIAVLEPTGKPDQPLQMRCTRDVPAGPFGLAASMDDASLVVTSTNEPALTVFKNDLTMTGAVALPRSPRGVLVDQDKKAFVSHVVGGQISVVALDHPERPRVVDTRVRAGSQDAQNLDLALLRSGTQGYALANVEIPRVTGGGERPTIAGGNVPATPTKPRPNAPLKAPPKKPPPGNTPMVSQTPDTPEVPATPAPVSDVSRRIIIPMVSVDPGDPARPTRLYYGPPPTAGVAKHAPVAILVDPTAEKSLSTHVLAPTNGLRSGECLLPRSMAYRKSTQKLYVTCMGVDLMLELDARAVDPMRAVTRRFQLPKGPTGVAVSDKDGLAVVWGQFDEALAVIPLGEGSTKTIDAYQGNQAIDADVALGRDLFYRSEDTRITFDGVACSSCHPDGAEDGVTWSTPEGMRQTPMLAGRLHGTAPYGWTRKQGTLEEYIADTSSRLGGSGLDPQSLAALAKYAKNLPTPTRSVSFVHKVSDNPLFEKGREVFSREGCDTCHVGGPGVDAKSHNVTLNTPDNADNQFDTPSLVRVDMTAPYFHDGRYNTLDELLKDPNSKMGNTAKLDADERNALLVYLESL